MSSEALERAEALLAVEPGSNVRSAAWWFAAARDMAREVAKLEAALAVAREREQRAAKALGGLVAVTERAVTLLDAHDSWLPEAEALSVALRAARAALVDEPAADESLTEEGGVNESSSGVHGQQMSPLPSPENDRSGRSSASTSPPAVSDSPAAATLAEPEQAEAQGEAAASRSGQGSLDGNAQGSGSASAAADEPARRKLGENDPGRYEIGVLIGPCSLAEATSLSERVSNATQGRLGAVVSLTTWREDDVAAADEPGETP